MDLHGIERILLVVYTTIGTSFLTYFLLKHTFLFLRRKKELNDLQKEFDNGYKDLFFMVINAKDFKNKKEIGLEINQLVEIKAAVDERIMNLVKAENK